MADLRSALQSIYEARGRLTPALVVDEARPDEHPLHTRFEWDDEVAGEAYRRVQAAELIRSVRVRYAEIPDGPKDVRAWVSVPNREDRSQAYHPVESVVMDDMARQVLLRDMEREWQQLKRRYDHMAEFAEMVRVSLTAAA